MLRGLSKALKSSTLIHQPHRNIFGFKDVLNTIKGVWKHTNQPGPARFNPHTMQMSETELFDEDAHELTAQLTNNPFDLDIMMGDTNPARNFGTVDNPVLMFSANVGWRYVMCSGLYDQDEGSSHAGVWFILRQGSIHRCPICGQCFKLINLKDEISEQNDYYLEHYMPILDEEMGDDDEWVQRWSFHNFADPYPTFHPNQNTHHGYILVNPDDHDRILTDPAYRIQKLYEGHQKLHTLHHALIKEEDMLLWRNGGFYPAFEYTPEDYQDLITAEHAIRKLDRVYEKVQKFQLRQLSDPENHERREKRMKERSNDRVDKGYTQYHMTNELEMQYMDYYQSDYDPEEDVVQEQRDYEILYLSRKFHIKNYEFIEEGLEGDVPAVMGTFEKKIFKFKHRMWNDDPVTYYIRNKRMISRYLERLKSRPESSKIDPFEIQQLASNEGIKHAIERVQPYRDYIIQEAQQQYKDYYESQDEDLADFDHISKEEKNRFAQIFEDYSQSPVDYKKYAHTIEKREFDANKSAWKNFTEHLSDLRNRLLPEAKLLGIKMASNQFGPGVDPNLINLEQEIQVADTLIDVFDEDIKYLDDMVEGRPNQ